MVRLSELEDYYSPQLVSQHAPQLIMIMLMIGARGYGVAGTRRRAEIAYIGGSPSLSTGVRVCIRVYTDHNGALYHVLLVLYTLRWRLKHTAVGFNNKGMLLTARPRM